MAARAGEVRAVLGRTQTAGSHQVPQRRGFSPLCPKVTPGATRELPGPPRAELSPRDHRSAVWRKSYHWDKEQKPRHGVAREWQQALQSTSLTSHTRRHPCPVSSPCFSHRCPAVSAPPFPGLLPGSQARPPHPSGSDSCRL